MINHLQNIVFTLGSLRAFQPWRVVGVSSCLLCILQWAQDMLFTVKSEGLFTFWKGLFSFWVFVSFEASCVFFLSFLHVFFFLLQICLKLQTTKTALKLLFLKSWNERLWRGNATILKSIDLKVLNCQEIFSFDIVKCGIFSRWVV